MLQSVSIYLTISVFFRAWRREKRQVLPARRKIRPSCETTSPMGFWESYLRLPRYQRVLLGLAGVAVGWYGPDFMSYVLAQGGKSNTQSKNGVNHVSSVGTDTGAAPRSGSG